MGVECREGFIFLICIFILIIKVNLWLGEHHNKGKRY